MRPAPLRDTSNSTMLTGVASAKVLGVLGYLIPHETQHGPPALNRYDRLCGYREECVRHRAPPRSSVQRRTKRACDAANLAVSCTPGRKSLSRAQINTCVHVRANETMQGGQEIFPRDECPLRQQHIVYPIVSRRVPSNTDSDSSDD